MLLEDPPALCTAKLGQLSFVLRTVKSTLSEDVMIVSVATDRGDILSQKVSQAVLSQLTAYENSFVQILALLVKLVLPPPSSVNYVI